MSNRIFDSSYLTQRRQNRIYARNIYLNNTSGKLIIANPQTSDYTSTRYATYDEGAQTEYYRTLQGGEMISLGGIANIPPYPATTTPPVSPSPPTALALFSQTWNSVTISFTAGSQGSSPITNYQYSADGGSTFTPFSPAQATSPVTISELSALTSYTILLKAVSTDGVSEASTSIPITTLRAPQLEYDPNNSSSYSGSGLTVNSVGVNGSITCTINDDGGSPVVTWTNGVPGTSRYVFGFNLGARMSTTNIYNFTNTFTINAWVLTGLPPGSPNINTLISNKISGYPIQGISCGWNSYNTGDRKMTFEGGNLIGLGPAQESVFQTDNNTIVYSSWQFLSYVFNNNTHEVNLYKNGTLIQTFTGMVTDVVTENEIDGIYFTIGQTVDNLFGMYGYLGIISIYNVEMNATEILNEFNSSVNQF